MCPRHYVEVVVREWDSEYERTFNVYRGGLPGSKRGS